MIVAIAILRDARYDDDGLTCYIDIRSNLGPELASKELHGFDVSATADDLELAIIDRVEQVCKNELGLTIDADHTVRLLTKFK